MVRDKYAHCSNTTNGMEGHRTAAIVRADEHNGAVLLHAVFE